MRVAQCSSILFGVGHPSRETQREFLAAGAEGRSGERAVDEPIADATSKMTAAGCCTCSNEREKHIVSSIRTPAAGRTCSFTAHDGELLSLCKSQPEDSSPGHGMPAFNAVLLKRISKRHPAASPPPSYTERFDEGKEQRIPLLLLERSLCCSSVRCKSLLHRAPYSTITVFVFCA